MQKQKCLFLNFGSLQNAVAALEKATNSLNDAITKADIPAAKREAMNQKLYKAEQTLLTKEGLPRRGWYRHAIYAPGFYTGYGVKTLPGIREAIEQRDFKEAQEQIEVAAGAINQLAAYLNDAAK